MGKNHQMKHIKGIIFKLFFRPTWYTTYFNNTLRFLWMPVIVSVIPIFKYQKLKIKKQRGQKKAVENCWFPTDESKKKQTKLNKQTKKQRDFKWLILFGGLETNSLKDFRRKIFMWVAVYDLFFPNIICSNGSFIAWVFPYAT